MPDDHNANLSGAWQAAAPGGRTLGAAVGGAVAAAAGAVVAGEIGADAGAGVADEATGGDVMVAAGVPAPVDEVELADVALDATVVVLSEQAAIRTIPATIQACRTARG